MNLYPHQEDAVQWLVGHRHFLLADAPRLGKTACVLAAFRDLVQAGKVQRLCVLCPKVAVSVWQQQAQQWVPGYDVQIWHYEQVFDGHLLYDPASPWGKYWARCHRHTPQRRGCQSLVLDRVRGEVLCCDEIHHGKHAHTRVAGAVRELARQAGWVWLLTGTPADHRAHDLQEICRVLGMIMPAPIVQEVSGICGVKLLLKYPDLKTILPGSLRRLKEDSPGYVQNSITNVPVLLPPRQREIYQRMNLEYERGGIHISRLLRLTQMALDPTLLPAYREWTDPIGKDLMLGTLLETIHRCGEKVVVWCPYLHTIDRIQPTYLGSLVLTGQTKRPRDVCRQFQEDPETWLLFANPMIGEGIQLDAADTAIYLARTPFLRHWTQSRDRIDTLWKPKPKRIIVMIATDTVDEELDQFLQDLEADVRQLERRPHA